MFKPFKVMQASICSGANIVNMQIPRQVITNVNSKEFKPADHDNTMTSCFCYPVTTVCSMLTDVFSVGC